MPDNPPHLWLPPRLLRKYQWAKGMGGALFAGIFAGWLVLEWSNPTMRVMAIVLLVLTVWVTVVSVIDDAQHARGRQLAVEDDQLTITTPGQTVTVVLADADHVEWREGDDATHDGADEGDGVGLYFIAPDGRTLAFIDDHLLRDQDEARSFVGWLREHTDQPLDVRWPQVDL